MKKIIATLTVLAVITGAGFTAYQYHISQLKALAQKYEKQIQAETIVAYKEGYNAGDAAGQKTGYEKGYKEAKKTIKPIVKTTYKTVYKNASHNNCIPKGDIAYMKKDENDYYQVGIKDCDYDKYDRIAAEIK
ncbi:hypothetical protein LI177_02875 [bacterium 210820-DFI.6.37]|nr:hypothetical protein [bacterium 210820-DFI.6.37]